MSNNFNITQIRKDFPILSTKIANNQLVYLDNAATTQKSKLVINSIAQFYQKANGSAHRGVHYLSVKATSIYRKARQKIANFYNIENSEEIIFVRGATEGINLVAQSWGRSNLKKDDEIIISIMEHHANIVPWQILAEEIGFKIKVAPLTLNYQIDFEKWKKLFTKRTRLVSLIQVSNALGIINPVEKFIKYSHSKGIPILLDGSQAVSHFKPNLKKLNCDFYTFSGHKVFAPTGIGVLYVKKNILEKMPPYQGGGGMIKHVSLEGKNITQYKDIPERFEAGTPNIEGVVGLVASIEYLKNIGYKSLQVHEKMLLEYATEKLFKIPNIKIYGINNCDKVPIVSFAMKNIHPHDIATILDSRGIAVRAGHHCCMPLMQYLKIQSTVRISFSFYNTEEEVDLLIKALKNVYKIFN